MHADLQSDDLVAVEAGELVSHFASDCSSLKDKILGNCVRKKEQKKGEDEKGKLWVRASNARRDKLMRSASCICQQDLRNMASALFRRDAASDEGSRSQGKASS